VTKCIVIGSSFSAVFASIPLVQKGYEVVMLDLGFDIEQENKEGVDNLKNTEISEWSKQDLDFLKNNVQINSGGVEKKLVYGSDYVYKEMNDIQPLETKNAKVVRSLAKGGLSNVWGCSILPYVEKDLTDWPLDYSEMVESYKNVMDIVGSSCVTDELDEIVPLHRKSGNVFFPLSEQAESLFSCMKKNKSKLNESGIYFGRSRLASNFDKVFNNKCSECGLCLYGCCFDYLFNTRHLLDDLLSKDNFTYVNNVLVDRVKEEDDKIHVYGINIMDKEDVIYDADKVYLGTGVISSTRILLKSLEAYDRPVIMKHSDHFQLPLFRFSRSRKVDESDLHTLSQISLVIDDLAVDQNLVHLQVYGYNDLYKQVLDNKLSGALSILKPLSGIVLDRLMIIKGYIHSNKSSHMLVTLKKGKKSVLQITGIKNKNAIKTSRAVASNLFKNFKSLRLMTLPFMAKVGIPGEASHTGGTFPMKKNPGNFESDTLGRPHGFKRLHVVDSTVFPSIPATTITLSIMANAHRIASNSE
jgi:choline dehydrogenase-like flavoprotein